MRKAKDSPKLDDLHLDLASGGLASLWNKRASQIFAECFISEPGSCCTDINLVKDAFMAHLKQLQTRYRAQVRDEMDESEPKFEKLERMQERKEKAHMPPFQLHHWWQAVMDNYVHNESMQQFKPILDAMPLEAMSGDESAHENGETRFVITNLKWRNLKVTGWFRSLDALHISTCFGLNDRPSPSQFPHCRIPSRRVEAHNNPPEGLPLNFYDPVWLSTLDEEERQQLHEMPPIDLTMSDSMA
ncbi:hypothetical protein L208DRAFT_1231374 [Tricholoma matsutake]|nr:hypothetical protein L208DRAFT_1231374 [Tricholoma matsutake 945]